MKNKKYLIHFNSIYFLLYFGLGCFIPYINLYFEQVHHFNGQQIGLINATSMLVGILFVPLFGIISDISNKTKQVLTFILLILIGLLQLYAHSYGFLIVLIVACLFEIFRSAAFPILDVLGTFYATKYAIDFGKMRAFGSAGYMIGSIFVGFVSTYIFLTNSIFASFSIVAILSLIALIPIQNPILEKKSVANVNIIQIFKNKNFLIIFIYIIFTTTLIDASSSFIGNHLISTLHAPQQFVSYFTIVMVLPEILLLPFAMWFLNKFGYQRFYLISSILVFIRLLVTGITKDPFIVLIMPLFHFTTIIISTVANLKFIRQKFESHQIATVITLLTACTGIVRAGYNVLFGYIYTISSHLIYISAACLVVIAIITIYKTTIFDK